MFESPRPAAATRKQASIKASKQQCSMGIHSHPAPLRPPRFLKRTLLPRCTFPRARLDRSPLRLQARGIRLCLFRYLCVREAMREAHAPDLNLGDSERGRIPSTHKTDDSHHDSRHSVTCCRTPRALPCPRPSCFIATTIDNDSTPAERFQHAHHSPSHPIMP